jgi:hypothetical protein
MEQETNDRGSIAHRIWAEIDPELPKLLNKHIRLSCRYSSLCAADLALFGSLRRKLEAIANLDHD